MAEEKQPAAADTSAAEAAATEAQYRKDLAEMVKGISEEEPKPEEPEKKPEEPKEGEEPKPEDEEAEEADESEDKEDSTEEKGDEEPEAGKYSKAFRALQKREAGLQQMKNEVLQREHVVHGRIQELERRESELAEFIKDLRIDPYDTLLKNKLLDEDAAEYASKQLYFRSKAAQADPKNKAEADRLQREYRMRLETQQTRQELQNMKRAQEQERAQAQIYQARDAYSAKLEATVDSYKSKTPLLAKALEKDPQRTLGELYRVANDLSAAKGEYADPALVVMAWTKERKRVLAAYGLAEPVATTQKEKSKPAVEKKGPTNGKSKTAVQDSSQLTDEEKEAQYRKKLAAMLKGEAVED